MPALSACLADDTIAMDFERREKAKTLDENILDELKLLNAMTSEGKISYSRAHSGPLLSTDTSRPTSGPHTPNGSNQSLLGAVMQRHCNPEHRSNTGDGSESSKTQAPPTGPKSFSFSRRRYDGAKSSSFPILKTKNLWSLRRRLSETAASFKMSRSFSAGVAMRGSLEPSWSNAWLNRPSSDGSRSRGTSCSPPSDCR